MVSRARQSGRQGWRHWALCACHSGRLECQGIAESFRFPARSVARPSTVASIAGHYELSEHVDASAHLLPASIQVPVSPHLGCYMAGRLDRPSSELLEFLRFPSRWIEQLSASGWPLTMPAMVGVPTATMATTITTRPAMALATGMALVASGVPLLTMAMPSAYARLVMHRKQDWLLPIPFARLLGNHFAAILLGSTPGLTSVRTAGTSESETMQLGLNGTVALALTSITSTPFVAA